MSGLAPGPDGEVGGAVGAVAALVHAYAERLDAGDLDGVAELFSLATWRSGRGTCLEGAAEVRRAYDGVILYDGSPRTRHVMSNLVVDVHPGGAAAQARCSFTVLQGLPGQALRMVLAGRYHDRFAVGPKGWHFTDRMIHTDLIGDLRGHMR